MDETKALFMDLKEMLFGMTLILLALAAAVFGYLFFQNTAGMAVCFYGGLVLLLVGALRAIGAWASHRKPDAPASGQASNTKEEP